MCQRFFLLLALLLPMPAPARDKPENWVEVRSPHFYVITNSNDKQARRVADQFERMRSVFHRLFPNIRIETLGPVTVLAIKDDKDFRALEPASYLAKGQLKLGGLFLRGPDKNYVLLRLDAEGEHPYAVVYHEYTHLLMSRAEYMPLWLNEGLAEFYQNTDIHEKEVSLGQPSPESLAVLLNNRLLPLPVLFAVDHNSPYYHEENKGSIFYGESWALTHYLEVKDYKENTHHLTDYAQLLAQHVDAITAAQQAFGDLKLLQSALDAYVRQRTFQYFKTPSANDVDDAAFQSQPLSASKADAVRADFLAYNDRTTDARALLDRILQEDPNNVTAQETMGFLEFRQGHVEEARKWYAEAVKLDSQSYLAHYYFAAISMNAALDASAQAQVESSLRASIKLNPNFAPSYDRLGAFLAVHHRDLEEARMMALNAVQLEPANLNFRMNIANILLQMERGKDAVAVIQNALHLAASPQESAMAENFLQHAQEYAQAQEERQRLVDKIGSLTSTSEANAEPLTDAGISPGSGKRDSSHSSGQIHFLTGSMKNVRCNNPALDLNVVADGKTLALHSANYFKIDFSALGVTLEGNLNPCKDLEGRLAKVGYKESAGKGSPAVVAIEIHK